MTINMSSTMGWAEALTLNDQTIQAEIARLKNFGALEKWEREVYRAVVASPRPLAPWEVRRMAGPPYDRKMEDRHISALSVLSERARRARERRRERRLAYGTRYVVGPSGRMEALGSSGLLLEWTLQGVAPSGRVEALRAGELARERASRLVGRALQRCGFRQPKTITEIAVGALAVKNSRDRLITIPAKWDSLIREHLGGDPVVSDGPRRRALVVDLAQTKHPGIVRATVITQGRGFDLRVETRDLRLSNRLLHSKITRATIPSRYDRLRNPEMELVEREEPSRASRYDRLRNPEMEWVEDPYRSPVRLPYRLPSRWDTLRNPAL
jgi:hypothetical protein